MLVLKILIFNLLLVFAEHSFQFRLGPHLLVRILPNDGIFITCRIIKCLLLLRRYQNLTFIPAPWWITFSDVTRIWSTWGNLVSIWNLYLSHFRVSCGIGGEENSIRSFFVKIFWFGIEDLPLRSILRINYTEISIVWENSIHFLGICNFLSWGIYRYLFILSCDFPKRCAILIMIFLNANTGKVWGIPDRKKQSRTSIYVKRALFNKIISCCSYDLVGLSYNIGGCLFPKNRHLLL